MLTLERVSMKRSDTPFSKTTPLIYQPLFLCGKNLTPRPPPLSLSLPPLFVKTSKTKTPSLFNYANSMTRRIFIQFFSQLITPRKLVSKSLKQQSITLDRSVVSLHTKWKNKTMKLRRPYNFQCFKLFISFVWLPLDYFDHLQKNLVSLKHMYRSYTQPTFLRRLSQQHISIINYCQLPSDRDN